jgi:hypothetical protein
MAPHVEAVGCPRDPRGMGQVPLWHVSPIVTSVVDGVSWGEDGGQMDKRTPGPLLQGLEEQNGRGREGKRQGWSRHLNLLCRSTWAELPRDYSVGHFGVQVQMGTGPWDGGI